MALAAAQQSTMWITALAVLQGPGQAQMLFWSPARHSRIRFPSILNSGPRADVGRQASTRVRNGFSGESERITTLRFEASSEATAIAGLSAMPSSAATLW